VITIIDKPRLRAKNMDPFQFMVLRSNKMKMNNLDSIANLRRSMVVSPFYFER
jgi:hypothetical protein